MKTETELVLEFSLAISLHYTDYQPFQVGSKQSYKPMVLLCVPL